MALLRGDNSKTSVAFLQPDNKFLNNQKGNKTLVHFSGTLLQLFFFSDCPTKRHFTAGTARRQSGVPRTGQEIATHLSKPQRPLWADIERKWCALSALCTLQGTHKLLLLVSLSQLPLSASRAPCSTMPLFGQRNAMASHILKANCRFPSFATFIRTYRGYFFP